MSDIASESQDCGSNSIAIVPLTMMTIMTVVSMMIMITMMITIIMDYTSDSASKWTS